jgi:hypothetical protein
MVVGAPDMYLHDLPAVRIFRVPDRAGVNGRQVEFTLEGPDQSGSRVEVLTGADGIAGLPAWRLGSAPGRYTATAVTDGWGPITFTVIVPGRIVAVYDLTAIDGKPLAVSNGLLTEGHYVLYDGGVYNAFYNMPVAGFTLEERVFGTYRRAEDDRIYFSMEVNSPDRSQVFVSSGVGVLSGREMTLQRGHPMDFEPELFVLR